MSAAKLQAWLVSEGIRDELDALVRLTVRTELANLVPEPHDESAVEIDWAHVLFAGSVLAQSETREHLEAALRIATAALLLSTKQVVKDAGGVLSLSLKTLARF